MDGATLGVLILAAYLVVSPDRVSLSLTRGSAGAAGKAVGRRVGARSGTSRGGARRRGATFRQAVRLAWADAREAATAARARRAAGHDTFSQIKRAGRSGSAAVGVAFRSSGRLTDRVRAGLRAAVDRWARQGLDNHRPAAAGVDQLHRAASAAAAAADQTLRLRTSEPATQPTNNNASTTTHEEGDNAMNITELESLEAVRAEARQAMEMSESLTEVVTAIKEWATGLADRWSGTEWGTADLDGAVAGVGEAAGTLIGGEALSESLVAVEDAVKRAEALGEVATEIGAHGHVDAFRSA